MHLIALIIFSLFLGVLPGEAQAQPWQRADPASAGWSVEELKVAQDYAATLSPTAVMVVQDGKVIARTTTTQGGAYQFKAQPGNPIPPKYRNPESVCDRLS